VTAGPPPPRPSTARLSAPPVAAARDLPRPPAITVSCWLWWLAVFPAFLTVVLALTKLDVVRGELDRAVRDSDPSATPERIDQVVDLSVLVIVCGGVVLGLVGALLALVMRGGRRWARGTLVGVMVLAVVYGVLVVSVTGWVVLAYAAVTVAAAVCMYLPGGRRWFT